MLLLLLGFQVLLSRQVSQVEARNAILQQEISFEEFIVEVKRMEELKADLERKLGVIKQLKANKTGPVHMLDQLSEATPEKLSSSASTRRRARSSSLASR